MMTKKFILGRLKPNILIVQFVLLYVFGSYYFILIMHYYVITYGSVCPNENCALQSY